MSTFTYKINKQQLSDGIRVQIKGRKNNTEHTFISKLSYKELEKKSYDEYIISFIEALEKKIDILALTNIY
tara:strand:- start:184 stop:396 length:213 start_codon:yes stop_codon:yes gene_type:complete